ncbi:MAG TPA: hypothetical protein PK033_14430 [Acetivibrio sp.]|jgi:hypothetical protein|nr:hypothetical protein [Defluviitaleaceae bacterium]HQA59053.1 hypothetical protein [Acetivibrio sp.]
MLAIKKQMYFEGKIYSSVGNRILVNKIDEKKKNTYLKIKELSILNYSQLYNRLFRHGIHSFYKIDESTDCIVIKRKILFYRDGKLFNTVDIENGSRPLRQGIVYNSDHIIYSEYYGNKERDPIHVFKYDFIRNKKEILYTFTDIRHIHFIQRSEREPNVLLIGTGDLDHECGIFKFNLKTRIMEKVGGGSQLWRAVSVLENGNDLIWGTDDPYNQNYIVSLNLANGKLKKLKKIAGPAYYSTTTLNGEMYLATTVEDRRKHKAIIYYSKDGYSWINNEVFHKDILHTKFFGYGLIEFIHNQQEASDFFHNLTGLSVNKKR